MKKQIKKMEGGKTFSAPKSLIEFISKAGRIEISSCYSVSLCLIIVNLPHLQQRARHYDVWHSVN